MQDELDRLAALLGRSVTLDSPTGRLLGHSVQSDDADGARISTILARQVPEPVRLWQEQQGVSTATHAVRLPANADLQMTARLCLPLRQRQVLRAYLWVVEGATALSAEQVSAVVEAGDRLLSRLPEPGASAGADDLPTLFRRLVAPAPVAEAERLVGAMVGLSPDLLGATARFLVGTPAAGADGGPGLASASDVAALTRTLSELARGSGSVVASTVAADRVVVLSLGASASEERRVTELLSRGGLVTGSGPDVSFAAPGLLRGLDQASLTAECAAADPRLPDNLAWEQLGVYQRFLAPGDLETWIEPLAALVEDDGSGANLLTTLETYFDLAGDAQRTAAELSLHRTTLYYRLNRAATQLGGDLSDGLWRTHLHLALKARRLLNARARTSA